MHFNKYYTLHLLVLFIGILHWQCQNETQMTISNSTLTIGQEKLLYPKITISQDGKVAAILRSDTLLRFQNNDYTNTNNNDKISEFKGHFIAEMFKDTVLSSITRCNYAKFYEATQALYLQGNVVIHNFKFDTLYAEDLTWNNNTRLFTTQKKVRIKKDGQLINGIGLEASEDLSEYKIFTTTGRAKLEGWD